MEVFISWSKPASKGIARTLRLWLPEVIQQIQPWVSEDDIEKGQRWNAAISQRLSECGEGIICVTRQNQAEPWLNFEAGALAKSLNESRVRPLLIDLPKHELKGPLGDFQGTELRNRDDMLELVRSLNRGCEAPLSDERLVRAFDRTWDEFQADVDVALTEASDHSATPPARPTEEVIAEVLDRIRSIQRLVEAQEVPKTVRARRSYDLLNPVADPVVNVDRLSQAARQYIYDAAMKNGLTKDQALRLLDRVIAAGSDAQSVSVALEEIRRQDGEPPA